MTSILRATAILGSSSFVTVLVGLASAKAFAVLIGPVGLGHMGLLQSLIGLSVVVASISLGTSLVRNGAEHIAKENTVAVAELRGAAWWLFWLLGGAAALLLVLFRVPVAQLMLGGTQYSAEVPLIALALIFSLAGSLQTSILNTYHRVGALAKVGIANSVLGTILAVSMVWIWREDGVVAAVVSAPIISWLVSRYFLHRHVPAPVLYPSPLRSVDAARNLLAYGAPHTLSMLVGNGVQILLPVLVLNLLDQASVGFYRAAAAISVTYLGFLLSAIAQDYFPRISALVDEPERLGEAVNQQFRLVMLLGVPAILGLLALAPFLVPLVYSPEFLPAIAVLSWHLFGDVFRLPNWTMGFVILARNSTTFMITQLVSGILMWSLSWLGIRLFGLAGIGLGFLATNVALQLINSALIRRQIAFVMSRENKRSLFFAIAAVAIVQTLDLLDLHLLHAVIGLLAASIFGVRSILILWREYSRSPGGINSPSTAVPVEG